jgi:signal transduction histidine kinase
MEVHLPDESHHAQETWHNPVAIDPADLRSLLSCLSHELCRPLASLRAGFDLLLGDSAAGVTLEQRGHLLTMVSLCDDLLRLTRGYLHYAGLASGCRGPSLATFSVGALIGELDSQFREVAQAAGLRFDTSLDEPEADVVTDASLCQQIFGNLVSNAIKYTPRGGRVRIEAQIGVDDWYVAVSDDGPGIPPESLERVFHPFYRLARDEHSGIEGNGLGLSVCRELTQQLSGSIFLDSTPGAGTTVKVQLPRRPPQRGSGASLSDGPAPCSR